MALSDTMDLALARLIVSRRQRRPFTAMDDLQKIPGITPAILQDLQQSAVVGQSGPYYRIDVVGQAGGQTRRLRALVKKNSSRQTVDVIQYEELSPER
jgi:hypothetical protein